VIVLKVMLHRSISKLSLIGLSLLYGAIAFAKAPLSDAEIKIAFASGASLLNLEV
jgi:hypothetical protein